MGEWIVKDNGHFGHYNNGKRALDLFMPEGVGGLFYRPVWLIRDETPKEKRLRKERERATREERRRQLQQKPMRLIYDPSLLPWQIVTDKDIIPSGTVLVEWDNMMFQWLDVVRTEKGIGRTIKIGNRAAVMRHTQIRLQDVIEEAVG